MPVILSPFPDGTIIVKESCADGPCNEGDNFAWLVATARKSDGHWTWNEYTRNFADEPFVEILAPEQVCVDCHEKVESIDWIYTPYESQ